MTGTICPYCERWIILSRSQDLAIKIVKLRALGLSIREIAKLVKCGSTNVFYHLNKAKKIKIKRR